MVDDIDRRILATIFSNARLPVSAVARRSGVTREVARYRLSKMEEDGVIKSYVARIAVNNFCEGICNLGIKLVRLDERRMSEILAFLKNHPAIGYIAELCGEFDIVAVLLYRDTEDLANMVGEVTECLGDNLKSHALWLYITEYKNDRRGLISPGNGGELTPVTFKKTRRLDLDRIDYRLLDILSQDCRMRNSEIAPDIGISEELVRQRIRRLEHAGIIYGYMVVVDYRLLGYEAYYMNLHMERITSRNLEEIKRYVRDNPYICYCVRLAGKHNLHFSVYARNREHYGELLADIRNHFGAALVDYSFHLLMKEHKEVFAPAGFFEAFRA